MVQAYHRSAGVEPDLPLFVAHPISVASHDADVIIIGAGAAGLAAAADLTRRGMRVLVLEARAQPGGRILTRIDPGSQHAVELGAEFIHGKPQEIWELLASHPAETYEGDGDEWCSERGRIGECEFLEQVQKLLEKMRDCSDPDRSFADFLRECGREADESTRRHALQYVTGFNAADAKRISVQSLVKQSDAEEQIEGDRVFRIRSGYRQIVRALLAVCAPELFDLRTGCVVRRVAWPNAKSGRDARTTPAPASSVAVSCEQNGTAANLTAPRALITVPLGILQSAPGSEGAIEFDPPLEAKREALSQLAMGNVVRVTLGFAERFWAALPASGRTLSGMHFLFSDDDVFPTWWTLAPDRAPILTGWSPADKAERLSGLPEMSIVEEALAALARVLKIDFATVNSQVRSAFVHDWQRDPFSRGAYSYVCVGGADAPRRLGEPLAGTLFFAGEATDVSGHIGTVHGAIASGRRAAAEIVESRRHAR